MLRHIFNRRLDNLSKQTIQKFHHHDQKITSFNMSLITGKLRSSFDSSLIEKLSRAENSSDIDLALFGDKSGI